KIDNSALIAQFDVPVGKIDKVPPAFVLWRIKRDVQERPPFRALRFADQHHLHFLRKAIAFARVTGNARTHYVLPRRRSAAVARNHVIEIQIIAIKSDAAVLTGVLVALEHVVARELYFLLRKPVEKEQHD